MVQFGVHAGPQECTIDELRDLWRRSEELGFDWISVWDHFYPAQVSSDLDCFESVACHAALAAETTRPRVGCLVYSAGFRHPAVLANAGATIDHLSGGRLEMGIGAGWQAEEYVAHGIPFESPGVRLRRMAEAVEIVRLLWTEETVTYDGEFWTLREATCRPRPVQRPSPRIWIGASGEQVALQLAGRLGDGWNTPFVSANAYRRKLEIVLAACPAPDRFATGVNLMLLGDEDLDEGLERRFGAAAPAVRSGTLHGGPSQVADRVREYIDAGAQWINVALRAPFDVAALERFAADVVPQFDRAS